MRVVPADRPESRDALRPDDLRSLRELLDERERGASPPVRDPRGLGDASCARADRDALVGLNDLRSVADEIAACESDALAAIGRRFGDRRAEAARERTETASRSPRHARRIGTISRG